MIAGVCRPLTVATMALLVGILAVGCSKRGGPSSSAPGPQRPSPAGPTNEPKAVSKPEIPASATQTGAPGAGVPVAKATAQDAAPPPGPVTPVRSLEDAGRLLRAATQPLLILHAGEQMVLRRRHGDTEREEWVEHDDADFRWNVPELKLTWTRRRGLCTVGTSSSPSLARCEGGADVELAALAALWSSAALGAGVLGDVRVEGVEVDKEGRPGLRVSSPSTRQRWWLQLDERGELLRSIQVVVDGVDGVLTRTSGLRRWRLTIDGEDRGALLVTPEPAGGMPALARLVQVPLDTRSATDPLEFAARRLEAIRTSRKWLKAGPIGFSLRWMAGKATLRNAVLPVLGPPDGTPNLLRPTGGDAFGAEVAGRAIDAALTAAKVPDGCWIALVLGPTVHSEDRGALALLPCGAEGLE